jgi:DNA repair exonuclease SbcCD ATPase subunit
VAQQDKERRQHRLTEIAPIVAKLTQVEGYQDQVAQLQAQIRAFSPDIGERLYEAEKRSEQLAEIGRTLPWLRSFAQERSGFAEALEEAKNARIQAETLQAKLQEHEGKRNRWNTQLLEAQEAEKYLLAEKAGALARYEDVCKKRERFEDAAAQQVCELCGREISEEHAVQEKERLQGQVEAARSAYEDKESLYQKAVEECRQYGAEIAALDAQSKQATRECKKFEDQLRDHQNEAVNHTRQLRTAFGNIRSPFRERIITFVPIEDSNWLETTYPTDSDLQALQDEADGTAAHESELRELRQQHTDWKDLKTRRTVADEQLTHLLMAFDVTQAMQDRNEQSCIDHELQRLEKEIAQLREDHEPAEKLLQEANENYDLLRDEEQERRTQLIAEQAGQEIMFRSLHSSIETLPADWQIQAESVSTDELDQLEQKRDSLASYKLQYEQLGQARKDKSSIKQRINELREQIDGYEPEVSQPADEVERELACKKVDRDLADDKRSQAGQRLAQLREQWEQRVNLEQQKRDAERLHYLYKLLAELLGRGGLQFHLIHEAENVITDLANGTLSGLSHGRMRLELQRDNEANRASTEKALDLLVYDRDTGQHAIPISNASGSQKFRIAVSLALAIGRYSNRTAHHVESVIIDEGFGSLDKAGRDDMIQELRTLGQQLARIILVSHQDDFAAAFPNRYSFQLVDKASCVTLVEDD